MLSASGRCIQDWIRFFLRVPTQRLSFLLRPHPENRNAPGVEDAPLPTLRYAYYRRAGFLCLSWLPRALTSAVLLRFAIASFSRWIYLWFSLNMFSTRRAQKKKKKKRSLAPLATSPPGVTAALATPRKERANTTPRAAAATAVVYAARRRISPALRARLVTRCCYLPGCLCLDLVCCTWTVYTFLVLPWFGLRWFVSSGSARLRSF